MSNADDSEFLKAVADACGLDLSTLSKLTLRFTAPNTHADVTAKIFVVDQDLTFINKQFTLTGVKKK